MTWTHKESSELYVSHRWKKFRSDYIKNNKPTACEACSKPIAGRDITLDHITPLTKSGGVGAFDEANIAVLCLSCNSKKNNRLVMRTNYVNNKLVSL
jgi:5-methylcytosine-specific restriction endonuclease McrA